MTNKERIEAMRKSMDLATTMCLMSFSDIPKGAFSNVTTITEIPSFEAKENIAMNIESAIQAMKKGIEDGQDVMNEFPESFTHYPALDIPKELVGNEHLVNTLGNEPGYRRLEAGELVQEGDESFGVFGTPWEPANKYQIGKPASNVGGFATWRRKL